MAGFLSALFSAFNDEETKIKENTIIPDNLIPPQHTYRKNVKWNPNARNIFDLEKEINPNNKLTQGCQFPDEPQTGDIYLDYDCYMYVYNMKVNEDMTYTVDESMNGWSVRRISTSSHPSFEKEILSEIAGKPVVSARYALSMMDGVDVIKIVIPETVKDVTGMFKSTRMIGNPTIVFNNTPEYYEDCFANNNIFGIVDEKPVIHNPAYQTNITGDCDRDILIAISKTTKFDNVSIR